MALTLFRNLGCAIPMIFLLTVTASLYARPADDENIVVSARESDSTEEVPNSDLADNRVMVDTDPPVKTLPFYGGAKGRYLLIHPSGKTTVTNKDPSYYGLKVEDEDEEDVGMEEGDGNNEDADGDSPHSNGTNTEDGVSIGLPPDNASVAEAKPVGLAIAGPGGVASSRPVATAVVGPGGLALAKPVATAVAGVPGAEALVGIQGGGKKKINNTSHKPSKNSNSSNPSPSTGITTTSAENAKQLEAAEDDEEPPIRRSAEEGLREGYPKRHNIFQRNSEEDDSLPLHSKFLFVPMYLPHSII